jgi:thiol:disulfide interchange protein
VVKARFKELGVVAFKANDDGNDPRIFPSAQRFDLEGYPINVVFPGPHKAIRLPTVLSQKDVLQALDEAEAKLKEKYVPPVAG